MTNYFDDIGVCNDILFHNTINYDIWVGFKRSEEGFNPYLLHMKIYTGGHS